MIELESTALRVELPVFEGPLDLLLYLIKASEVDIYDIEIARITEQYLAHLRQMEEMDLEVAGEFLVMAANLIYIKSRTLLPVEQQPPEEDAEEDDPRWELIRQLVEYKKFKEAAHHLQHREEIQHGIYHRIEPAPIVKEEPAAPGLGKVSMFDLISAFQKVLDRLKEKQGVREIYEENFTVGQKIDYILDRITQAGKVTFSTLFGELASRNEIVVTFLALLELIRLKQLKVQQSDSFGEIDIERA
jgi:segregation and condensation protein A